MLRIGLAVLNAGDNGDCCVQHDAVCVNVGNVSAGIGQFCINNILVMGLILNGAEYAVKVIPQVPIR